MYSAEWTVRDNLADETEIHPGKGIGERVLNTATGNKHVRGDVILFCVSKNVDL